MPWYAVLPFVAMLVAIAICPLWVPHWWERNRNKPLVSCGLGLPVAGFYLVQRPPALLHTLEEYLSFMLLLAALYTISGGIRLTGDLEATPLTNTAFLAVGSVLASLIGTTGASVLLSGRESARPGTGGRVLPERPRRYGSPSARARPAVTYSASGPGLLPPVERSEMRDSSSRSRPAHR